MELTTAQLKKHIEQKTVSLLSALELATHSDVDGPLLLSQYDRAEVKQVVNAIRFHLAEVANYIHLVTEEKGKFTENLMKAIKDKDLTDEEKIAALNNLVCNMLDAMPEGWRDYYLLKLNGLFSVNGKQK